MVDMPREEQQVNKIYDETASLIVDLSLRNQISHHEMHFLLSLLDQVVVKGRNPELMKALKEWDPDNLDPEINEIIKATLLALDMRDNEKLKSTAVMIEELISA